MAEIQFGETVLLHLEDFEDIEELEDADAGILLKSIVEYMRTRSVNPRLDGGVLIMFRYIRRHIDRDKATYRETCRKRAESGKLGGRPKKANGYFENQIKAKKANGFFEKQNNPVSESDSESEIESESDSESVAPAANAASVPPAGEERERRIRFLQTMLRMGPKYIEPQDLERYRGELESLTGGV